MSFRENLSGRRAPDCRADRGRYCLQPGLRQLCHLKWDLVSDIYLIHERWNSMMKGLSVICSLLWQDLRYFSNVRSTERLHETVRLNPIGMQDNVK
jgi:hypothetical protein